MVKNLPASARDPERQEFHPWEDPPEKEMAAHSSVLDWRILWTEEPGGLWPTGSQRVRHDCSDLARVHTCTRIGESNCCTSDSNKECKSIILQYETNIFKNQKQIPPVPFPGQFYLT